MLGFQCNYSQSLASSLLVDLAASAAALNALAISEGDNPFLDMNSHAFCHCPISHKNSDTSENTSPMRLSILVFPKQ